MQGCSIYPHEKKVPYCPPYTWDLLAFVIICWGPLTKWSTLYIVPYKCHAGLSASNLPLGMLIVLNTVRRSHGFGMYDSILFFTIPTFDDLFLVDHLELNSPVV
jgi:hypothetical protein